MRRRKADRKRYSLAFKPNSYDILCNELVISLTTQRMQKIKVYFALAAWLTLFASHTLGADTITITPTGYVTAPLGGTVQLTAQGPAGVAISWAASIGTITPAGLYTAPTTMPASGAVQITASETANPGVSSIRYIYLLTAGPTISSVTPNPLAAGTINVTINGVGFLAGATVMAGAVQMSTTSVTPSVVQANTYVGPATTSVSFYVTNPGSGPSNTLIVPVTATGSGGGGGGGTGTAPVISPAKVTVALGATQQFSAPGATTWSAVAGVITAAGLYTAPASMPASGVDTVTAKNAAGQSTATVTLVSNIPPTVSSIGTSPLPLGVFSTTVAGTGFTAASTAQLNGVPLTTVYTNPAALTVSGFAGPASSANLTVSNGALASAPLVVAVGVQNALVSASAARRFLEQAAFGPTPQDAAHVQTIGFAAWIAEQIAMPAVSNYNAVTGSQGGISPTFLANAVTNPDQLRQRVAFALSQIFVTSITKIIWNGDMVPYQHMLIADAFTNYRKILGDVTLSPAMGEYLDMANNAKANPAAGTAANENYARECMQLFSMGDVLLNPDGTVQVDGTGAPLPTYLQTNVTELARVFTGWTYAPKPNQPVSWPTYINSAGPMVPYTGMHDFGSKTLLNGYVAAANLTPQQDLQAALDNIAATRTSRPSSPSN